MNRRDFLKTTSTAAALSTLGGYVAYAQDQKPLRAALIGTGWYGKVDLLRLIQIAPQTEVVSLCDVDKKQLTEAGEIVAGRVPWFVTMTVCDAACSGCRKPKSSASGATVRLAAMPLPAMGSVTMSQLGHGCT